MRYTFDVQRTVIWEYKLEVLHRGHRDPSIEIQHIRAHLYAHRTKIVQLADVESHCKWEQFNDDVCYLISYLIGSKK